MWRLHCGVERMKDYKCLKCDNYMLKNSFGFWCNSCQKYFKKAKLHGIVIKWTKPKVKNNEEYNR